MTLESFRALGAVVCGQKNTPLSEVFLKILLL
jgi:hypothetical protein